MTHGQAMTRSHNCVGEPVSDQVLEFNLLFVPLQRFFPAVMEGNAETK
jgi:hypothetical protein